MYAKRIREKIKILTILDGRSLENEDEILREVYDHYRRLYIKNTQVDFYQPLRDEILSLINMKFTKEYNEALRELPKDEEIQRIVFGFPWGKSPRGDGVNYEFLQES